nr:hypothetical protein Iba_chr01bCG5320 [Ipomoea batatas]
METLSLQYNATTILLLLSSSILLTIELKSTRLAAARQRQTGEEAVTYGEGEVQWFLLIHRQRMSKLRLRG